MASSTPLTSKQILGKRIVRARARAEISQRELAERLVNRLIKSAPSTGAWHRDVVSMQRSLRRYENGHNEPRGEMLMAIAAETDADARDFTSGDDDDEEEDEPLRRIASQLVLRGHDDLASDLFAALHRMNERKRA